MPAKVESKGPLAGLRILDLTSVAMGPYATQTLGDLGADVIKIEPPQGDLTRHNAPGRHAGMSSLFLQLNRSKRSVVLDLKDAAGRDALLQLARGADALVCNVRPKAMARLGLGYEVLAGVNPKLVYCALVGFGQDGPYAERAALDDLIQAGCGMAALAALAAPQGGPQYAPGWIADQGVGLVATYALLAALLHRERSGQGQMIEVPMFESMVQFTMTPHLYGQSFRPPIGGTGYPRIFARRPFKTLDGHLGATAYTPAHWHAFFDIIGRPELKDDPRFADQAGVARHVGELNDLFAAELRRAQQGRMAAPVRRRPTFRRWRCTRRIRCSTTRTLTPSASSRMSNIPARARSARWRCRPSGRTRSPRRRARHRGWASTASMCCARPGCRRRRSTTCSRAA